MEIRPICFATNNPHKIKEVQALLPETLKLATLKELGLEEDLPENQRTLEGNSMEKARFVNQKLQVNCVADDTGLEIDALGGQPGVDTAHFAGPERDAGRNMEKVLQLLEGKTNRDAAFRTVFTLIWEGEMYSFEGVVKGRIALEPRGAQGFGYDPIFIPEGFDQTFAELGSDIKNRLSHRARATHQLVDFLKTL